MEKRNKAYVAATTRNMSCFFPNCFIFSPRTLKLRGTDCSYLKLASNNFYQIFIFSPIDSLSKTMKNVSYFIKKTLFVLKIFKFS